MEGQIIGIDFGSVGAEHNNTTWCIGMLVCMSLLLSLFIVSDVTVMFAVLKFVAMVLFVLCNAMSLENLIHNGQTVDVVTYITMNVISRKFVFTLILKLIFFPIYYHREHMSEVFSLRVENISSTLSL